jgi:hypothetical protein
MFEGEARSLHMRKPFWMDTAASSRLGCLVEQLDAIAEALQRFLRKNVMNKAEGA